MTYASDGQTDRRTDRLTDGITNIYFFWGVFFQCKDPSAYAAGKTGFRYRNTDINSG